MPTQEERLTFVEHDLKQFRTETIKAYGDMAYEIVIVKGLGEDSIKRLAALTRQVESIDTRLSSIENRLTNMETMLTQILTRLPQNP